MFTEYVHKHVYIYINFTRTQTVNTSPLLELSNPSQHLSVVVRTQVVVRVPCVPGVEGVEPDDVEGCRREGGAIANQYLVEVLVVTE